MFIHGQRSERMPGWILGLSDFRLVVHVEIVTWPTCGEGFLVAKRRSLSGSSDPQYRDV